MPPGEKVRIVDPRRSFFQPASLSLSVLFLQPPFECPSMSSEVSNTETCAPGNAGNAETTHEPDRQAPGSLRGAQGIQSWGFCGRVWFY